MFSMQVKRRHIDDFEKRSVMLFATLLVGTALVASARAQPAAAPLPAVTATSGATVPGTSELSAPAKPVVDTASKLRLSAAQVQQAFQYVDTDHDGSLSRKEVGVFPRIERHFERIDTNHDGVISPAEFDEALQQAS
jgi:hypothetical protein